MIEPYGSYFMCSFSSECDNVMDVKVVLLTPVCDELLGLKLKTFVHFCDA